MIKRPKEKIADKRPDFDLSKEKHDIIIRKFLDQKKKISKEHNVTE